MRAFRITLLILALSALVLFLAWAKGWVGHLHEVGHEARYPQEVVGE